MADPNGLTGFRFVSPIRYAGADFGKVDLVLRRSSLDAAIETSRNLLIALSAFVMLVVLLIGWLSADLIEGSSSITRMLVMTEP